MCTYHQYIADVPHGFALAFFFQWNLEQKTRWIKSQPDMPCGGICWNLRSLASSGFVHETELLKNAARWPIDNPQSLDARDLNFWYMAPKSLSGHWGAGQTIYNLATMTQPLHRIARGRNNFCFSVTQIQFLKSCLWLISFISGSDTLSAAI